MAFGTLEHGTMQPDFDLVAVGWSTSRNAPASYLITSHDRVVGRGLTSNAWQLLELPEVLIAPPIAEAQIATTGWKVPYSVESFRPDIDGIPLLQAQRLSRRELDERSGIHGHVHVVGGFIQVTTVSAGGVNSRVVHRWPDQVGRRIEPQAGA
jgi:hypothetical protein